jgi:hypothetical protein
MRGGRRPVERQQGDTPQITCECTIDAGPTPVLAG